MSFRSLGNFIVFGLLLFLFMACYVVYNQPKTSNHTQQQTPRFYTQYATTPSTHLGEVVKHTYYSLSYAEQHEQAEWVAYTLKPEHTIKNTNRKDNFRIDPFVMTESAHPNDYKKSGYDRGHLLPSADMVFSEQANAETFYMSNMSPQSPYFNRGIWKKLEEQVRDYTHQRGELFIITGPVLTDSLPKIGENGVSVPHYYYKIIADIDSTSILTVSYLLKNEKSDKALSHFIVSIDSIETLTNIDFFTEFPDSLEAIFESKVTLF